MTELPRRAFTRTVRLASLPLGIVGRAAIGAGQRLGGRPAQAVTAELQARTAEHLFTVLGELKGGAMKVGQALSMVEGALPEDLAGPYRATLTRLQDSAPPMPASTVHTVLAEQLGRDWPSLFEHFDDRPTASASIGQVHRARWRDGTDVAVKVQYPGVGPALLGDFRRLSRVAKLAGSWIPGVELGPLMDELVGRVAEELDYAAEARHQRAFAAAFEGDPHVSVPAVVHQHGAVLVTGWLPGTPLSTIIAHGEPAQRQLAARRYLEFLVSGPQRARLLHADPHPGNFRLLADGRLGVLDFGAVDPLPGGLPPAMGRVLARALDGDAQSTLAGLRAEGFVRQGSRLDADRLLGFIEPFIEPLRPETFRFERAWLRAQSHRLQDPRQPDFGFGFQLNLPPEYLMIHRVWLGGLGVLCQLEAEVPAREIVRRWLPGDDAGPAAAVG